MSLEPTASASNSEVKFDSNDG